MANKLRRKGTRARQVTIASLGVMDILLLSGGPHHRRPDDTRFHCESFQTLDDVRQFWQANREHFMQLRDPAIANRNMRGYFAGRRPWAWWQFDSPEERNHELPQVEQLDRMGELSANELAILERACKWPPANEAHARYFRRPWSWWKWHSPEPRDWSKSEAYQLATLDRELLTRYEIELLKTGKHPLYQKQFADAYFSADEIKTLKIPAAV